MTPTDLAPTDEPSDGLLKRTFKRWWAPLLVLWIALSFGLGYLAYTNIQRNYTATILLIIRSTTPRIYDMQSAGVGDLGRFQRTQVQLVTSADVLGVTLAEHPELASFGALAGLPDPEAEIRKLVRAQVVPDTNLISVSMTSDDRQEAVAIVDAVVDAYLRAANTWASDESQQQIKRLKDETEKLKGEIAGKREKLRNLVSNVGTIDPTELKDQGKVSFERFQSYLNKWDSTRFERIRLESELESARLHAGRVAIQPVPQPALEKMVRAVLGHPQVAELMRDKTQA